MTVSIMLTDGCIGHLYTLVFSSSRGNVTMTTGTVAAEPSTSSKSLTTSILMGLQMLTSRPAVLKVLWPIGLHI